MLGQLVEGGVVKVNTTDGETVMAAVQGGFLSVTVKPEGAKSAILFQLRDVMGKVVYEWGTTSA